MNKGSRNIKRRVIVSSLLLVFIVLFGFFAIKMYNKRGKDNYSFDKIEAEFFYLFNRIYPDENEYEFHSLESYYFKEGGDSFRDFCFIHASYLGYIEVDEKWADIDIVYYGQNSSLEGCFGLNWDSLEGFERHVEQYQKAVKEGVKKTYSLAEIQEMIDKYKPED